MTAELDELRRLGEELREVFANERRAIAALDHARLEQLAETKRALAERLAALRAPTSGSSAAKQLFEAIRIEAQATAMLAAAASQTVRAMLGYDAGATYNRRAQRVTNGPVRLLATY